MISELISSPTDLLVFPPSFPFLLSVVSIVCPPLWNHLSDKEYQTDWEFSSLGKILKSYRIEKTIKKRKENKFLKLHSVTKGRKSRKKRENQNS